MPVATISTTATQFSGCGKVPNAEGWVRENLRTQQNACYCRGKAVTGIHRVLSVLNDDIQCIRAGRACAGSRYCARTDALLKWDGPPPKPVSGPRGRSAEGFPELLPHCRRSRTSSKNRFHAVPSLATLLGERC